MLKKPLFTTVFDITLMVAMRVLNCVKTDFSTQTGCWVHFVWRQRTALFYGMDLAAGQAYLRSIIDLVKNCIVHPGGCNGFMVQEYSYNMRVKRFLKKNVDNIEKQSSSNLVIQSEDPLNGTLRVQYFGSPKNIQSAHDMVLNYLGASKSPPSSDSSLSTGGNTPSSDQSVSDLPESPTLDNVFPINVEGKQYLAMIPSPSTLAALREATAPNGIVSNVYPNINIPALKSRQENQRPVWNKPNGTNTERMYLEGLTEEVFRRTASNIPQPPTDSTWVVQLLNKVHTVGADPLDHVNNNSNMFHTVRVPPTTGPFIGDRYNHSMNSNMDVFRR